MHTCFSRLLVLILSCLIVQAAAAQVTAVEPRDLPRPDDAPLRFDHLTIDDGLSQQSISTIIQDRHGFMWFGTEDGLNRYDGHSIKKYLNDPRDPGSLRPRFLSAIEEDEDGMLWIGQTTGLSRFDPGAETFTHYQHDETDPTSLISDRVWSILQDRQGGLWIGTDVGLDRFEPDTGTFTHYLPDPNRPDDSGFDTNAIVEDRSGILWLATSKGLVRFDKSSGLYKRYLLDPDDLTPQGANLVTALYEDRRGALWAGAQGLYRFDPETETFEDFFVDSDAPSSPAFSRVRAIAEDDTGVLWVGDTRGGLSRIDRGSGTFKRYLHDPADPHSLNSNEVWSIYPDRQGILWVGTFTGGGVNRVDRTTRPFAIYPMSSSNSNGIQGGSPVGIYLDRDDVLWIGTRGGVLNRYDRQRDVYTYYRHDESDPESLLPGRWIRDLHRDRQGRFWVGTGGNQGGLSLLDEDTGRFTHYRNDPNDSTSIASNNVQAIYEDRDGVLWVGAGGLNWFDPSTGSGQAQASGTPGSGPGQGFTRYVHDPDDSTSISGNERIIYEDLAGHLWVGTWGGGLNRFDRETGTFTRYQYDESDPQTLNNNIVLWIYERSEEPGVLWISSFGGLDRFDVQTGRFIHYTTQNSDLPSNAVTCVLGDDEGHLWLSTFAGLARFDPDTERFRVFRTEDGLQMLEFDIYSCHQGYNGELFFGGAGGVNAIWPGDVFDNPHPPEVALTGLRLFNEPVTPGPDAPLQTSITETESITLAHDQNDLTLEYAGLHFRHPERNQYAHMLEGFEDAWREVGTERRASYTNLPPGDYTFRVKATNSDGVWNEDGRSLAITILPPWWRTIWAYLVYGFLFLGGVFVVDRWQRRRLVARERLRAEREKAAVLEETNRAIESTNNELQRALKHLTETQDQLIHTEKMASLGQLTAGIAHEIKNPLNFVNNFAQINAELLGELKRNPDSRIGDMLETLDDLDINTQKINEHGQRADGIIRAMLEHSRTAPGERQAVDVNRLLDEYVNLAYHGVRAREDGFTVDLHRDYDEAVGEVELIPQEIGRVFINLLDNAFYAVNEKRLSLNGQYAPAVSVSTRKQENGVEIRVLDNGTGVPEEVRDKIFEPFFTTKPAGSGTGLGLSLSYDIVVKGHGGSLAVESEEGEGAAFVVKLPVGIDA